MANWSSTKPWSEHGNSFDSLIGEYLRSIEFQEDCVYVHFGGGTLFAYNPPTVTADGRAYCWGDDGYRDALCGRICTKLRAAQETDEEIVLELSDGSSLSISLRPDPTSGPEAAELSEGNDTTIWQF